VGARFMANVVLVGEGAVNFRAGVVRFGEGAVGSTQKTNAVLGKWFP